MKRITIILSAILAAGAPVAAQQTTTSTSTAAPAATLTIPAPTVFGIVKGRFETSAYDGDHRFSVRHSRLGVHGDAGGGFGYMSQMELSDDGRFAVLDAYASYTTGGFAFSLGQQVYNFSGDATRGPATNFFANRSILSKFLTTYNGSSFEDGVERHTVAALGARDIGALASYTPAGTPVKFMIGAFNGSGINSPVWSDRVNLTARIEAGGTYGWKVAASHYNGYTPEADWAHNAADAGARARHRLVMWNGELSYTDPEFWVEVEYAQRRLRSDRWRTLNAALIQGYRIFRLDTPSVRYITATARWDTGDGIEYLDMADNSLARLALQRITVGANVGFTDKQIGTEVRLNFEKYVAGNDIPDLTVNRMFQDKVILEVVVSF